MNRRQFLVATGATGLTAVAGCLGGGGGAPAEPEPGDWFAPVSAYQGFADMTDTGEITVLVGAGESGYLFDPVAVAVAPGTTITWEWTGDGGSHNVAERDEEWANPGGTLSTEGHTWSREFSSGGTELYECWPHSSLGMRGGIFIDENPDSGPEYGINETESDTQNQTEGNETPGDSNASGNETPSENQTADGNRS